LVSPGGGWGGLGVLPYHRGGGQVGGGGTCKKKNEIPVKLAKTIDKYVGTQRKSLGINGIHQNSTENNSNQRKPKEMEANHRKSPEIIGNINPKTRFPFPRRKNNGNKLLDLISYSYMLRGDGWISISWLNNRKASEII